MAMRLRHLSATALLAAALPLSGQAAVTEENFLVRTTGDLVALCTAERGDPLMTAALNFCHGFGVGVYQTLVEQEAGRQRDHLFCVRGQTPSRNEAVADFVAWAKGSPNRMEVRPADGIARFLAERFPCGKSR
jgi:hypothetical protein